ncbi:hypothetical protein [Deinococcus radiotolerans]|uniref:Uncharacterized protein n=1 Tax=Deinococcus radiotolerans TaxID=1309407 RepID=A0ABQ2FNE7_9DEIO|nr:hypothetical protein [Deinococcus radiotolerans]GGL11274.1 hypothetical protein GCM10010844_32440 [Deinococcus radiotolerans]
MLKRNLMMMAALTSVAGAQTTVTSDDGVYQLLGCSVQSKQVVCDVTFALTKEGVTSKYFDDVTVFGVDGTLKAPEVISFGGTFRGTSMRVGGNVYTGIPVRLSIVTELPVTTTVVRALVLDRSGQVRWDNIPVRGATAAAPTPVPAAVNIAGNWTATLTNCTTTTPGVVVCTATLRK